jgi:hypothetical protein
MPAREDRQSAHLHRETRRNERLMPATRTEPLAGGTGAVSDHHLSLHSLYLIIIENCTATKPQFQ